MASVLMKKTWAAAYTHRAIACREAAAHLRSLCRGEATTHTNAWRYVALKLDQQAERWDKAAAKISTEKEIT